MPWIPCVHLADSGNAERERERERDANYHNVVVDREARTVEAGFHATLLPAPPPTEVPFIPTKDEDVILFLPPYSVLHQGSTRSSVPVSSSSSRVL